ncbi:MAG: endolytic transglycosylase MltG [Acidobacteriia bacterium]|nr:endolytic transglycosylase MltG [Terriglobia bacterium]
MKILRVPLLLAAVAGGFLLYRLSRPYQGFEGERFVDVPRGTSTRGIAALLADAGVVRSRWDFLLARYIERGRKVQAGEYRFQHPATPLEIFDRMARGDIFYYEMVVPEGWNMFDIGAALERTGLFPAEKFVSAARDPRLIRDLDPRAPTLEGYLFPDSYRLSRHATPEQVCRLMTGRFREEWRKLGAGADAHDTVTVASLVEKESKLPDERPLVAAVFENRLRIGMKLDCDPTTIYAALLDDRYRGTIYKSDLESDNPYNTYKRAGLPPGPIANPGLDSIRAALDPAASGALYFVLRPDGSGAHQFSANIADHEAAIAKYRRALRK